MNPKKRIEIFSLLKQSTPNAKTELVYSSPFQLLIAVILSAQSTDKSVNKATKKLFHVASSAKKLSKLSIETVETYIKTIGLYKTKAKNILLTSKFIEENYDGAIPHDRYLLESLPGVGRKTANVILNTIFGDPVIAVDTHIFRLANRINLAAGRNPLEVEKRLTKLTPKKYLVDAHHLLILHGRYVCKAKNPSCSKCIIFDLCESNKKTKKVFPS
ncbi:endonuclease III [Methylophilaceae bacterium]|nr:endonuclease III [Methylophilaceae bacterium]|tara:strand:+ start:25 stop:672 length:648 start_codon:yes stop_codon:yes gene_type:complete